MKPKDFKKGIQGVFSAVGYVPGDGFFIKTSSEISILMQIQKNFGTSYSLNIGFWLHSLENLVPSRFESAHMYFRLERLFPDLLEIIRYACLLEEPGQIQAYEELLNAMNTQVLPGLETLGTLSGLVCRWKNGDLRAGLVLARTREFLDSQ